MTYYFCKPSIKGVTLSFVSFRRVRRATEKREPMARITESGEGHYEAREVPFGKVYEWNPEHVALECECGEKSILTATSVMFTRGRCGADLRGLVHDIRVREGRLADKLAHAN